MKCGPCQPDFESHEFCYWFDGDDCDCDCHANYVRWVGTITHEDLPTGDFRDAEELIAIHVYEDDLYEVEQDGELTDFGFLPLPEEPDSD